MTARHWRIADAVFRLACAANCFVAAWLNRDFGGGLCLGVGIMFLAFMFQDYLTEQAHEANKTIIDVQQKVIATLELRLALAKLGFPPREGES